MMASTSSSEPQEAPSLSEGMPSGAVVMGNEEWRDTREPLFRAAATEGFWSWPSVMYSSYSLCNCFTMVDVLFSYYLVEFLVYNCQVPGSSAGLMLLISEIFNMFVGLAASVLMDRYPMNWLGKHRFWILVSLLPLGASFVCLWISPSGFNLAAKFAYYLGNLLVFNFAYGTLLVAYEGVIPMLFSNETKLAQINSWRLCVGSISSVVATIMVAGLSQLLGDKSIRYFLQAAIVAGLVVGSFLAWVLLVREKAHVGHDRELEAAVAIRGARPSVPLAAAADCSDLCSATGPSPSVDISLDPGDGLPMAQEFVEGAVRNAVVASDELEAAKDATCRPPVGPPLDATPWTAVIDLRAADVPSPAQDGAKQEHDIRGGQILSEPSNGGQELEVKVADSPQVPEAGSWEAARAQAAQERPVVHIRHMGPAGATTNTIGLVHGESCRLQRRRGHERAGADAAPPLSCMSDEWPLSLPGSASASGEELGSSRHLSGALSFPASSSLSNSGVEPPGGSAPPTPWRASRALWKRKAFVVLLLNHFLLWSILIFTHATLPIFVREHLQYGVIEDEPPPKYLAKDDEKTPASLFAGPALVVATLQFGTAVAQVSMGLWPDLLEPEKVLRWSLVLMTIAKVMFVFLFDLPATDVEAEFVYLVAFIDGLGQGGLFAAFEIMVPEVILDDEYATAVRKENLIYGWVDCVRELALALSFEGVGLVLSYVPLRVACRLLIGMVPLPLIVATGLVHWYFPHIILNRERPAA